MDVIERWKALEVLKVENVDAESTPVNLLDYPGRL